MTTPPDDLSKLAERLEGKMPFIKSERWELDSLAIERERKEAATAIRSLTEKIEMLGRRDMDNQVLIDGYLAENATLTARVGELEAFRPKCIPCDGTGESGHGYGIEPQTCPYCKGEGRRG